MFSRRIPDNLKPNPIAALRQRIGEVPYDLTVTNPTLCDLPYPENLLEPLANPAGLTYRPEPLGLECAREAVAEEYRRSGVVVDPRRIVLVASSSEAYALLFKLLCDPGDEIFAPVPSYPLLDHLASLEGVRAVPYRLHPDSAWQPHAEDLDSPRARAAIVVHPNNPTGSYLDDSHRGAVLERCRERGLALVADEVFHAFPLSVGSVPRSFATTTETLTFTLGGLSKHVGLPQIKLSWIVIAGPDETADPALQRLEFIADQYLSVSTPAQLALPRLLAEGVAVRAAILGRCRANLEALVSIAAGARGIEVPRPQGGWSALVRFPALVREEALVLELLEKDGVAVLPGYFFDFPREGWLVLSLLPEPAVFAEGCRRLLARL